MEKQLRTDQSQIHFVSPYQLRVLKNDTQFMALTFPFADSATQNASGQYSRTNCFIETKDGYVYILFMFYDSPTTKVSIKLGDASLSVAKGEILETVDLSTLTTWGGSFSALIAAMRASYPTTDLGVWYSSLTGEQTYFFYQDTVDGFEPAYFNASAKINYSNAVSVNYWPVAIREDIFVNNGLSVAYFDATRPFIPLDSFKASDLNVDTFIKGKENFYSYQALKSLDKYFGLGMSLGLNQFTLQPQQVKLTGTKAADDRLIILEQL